MLKRNACVVLGNIGTHEDLAVLEAMLVHEHEIVREHAASAMARLKTDRATWSDTRLTPGRRMRAP
ncbi:HEAT repeat domain-containing protein [Gemmatimonas sp.]|uniref:HEAT repeat domain-containing protein n=1 Tax=Gemmatimonas sp. TaxID=1962908 RepID=UPI00286BB864|nr:HEAT repeat domain-containing protein [Gemmatimonas sp.]